MKLSGKLKRRQNHRKEWLCLTIGKVQKHLVYLEISQTHEGAHYKSTMGGKKPLGLQILPFKYFPTFSYANILLETKEQISVHRNVC